MARPFVSDIREHDRVEGFFLVQRKSLLQTKSGSSYLSITLGDRTGEIEGRVWDNAEALDQAFERGSYVQVFAVASAYNGRMQLKVDSVRPVAKDELDLRDFAPSTRFDVELMWTELREIVDGVGDDHVRQMLNLFLDDPKIGPLLKRAPAAKNVHHPFLGGLLEHTLSILQLCHRVADHYPRANRDLLVAGALLHDIGKTHELRYDGAIDYSTEGRLVGHLVMTCQWIHEKAAQIPGFPEELKIHLTHLVAAHHGELEHGSPKVPHTLEAMIVHALDELDSRVQSWTMIFDRDRGEEWTEFQRLYDRFLYKGPGWGREKAGHGPAPEGKPWQGQSLYRREAQGTLGTQPLAPPAEPKRRREPKVPAAQTANEEKVPAQPAEPPAMFDLFASRSAGRK